MDQHEVWSDQLEDYDDVLDYLLHAPLGVEGVAVLEIEARYGHRPRRRRRAVRDRLGWSMAYFEENVEAALELDVALRDHADLIAQAVEKRSRTPRWW